MSNSPYAFLLAGLSLGFLLGWVAARFTAKKPSNQEIQATEQAQEPAGINLLVNGNNVEVSSAVMAEIQGLIVAGQKAEAAKRLREATGLNLAAAKSVIESLEKVVK